MEQVEINESNTIYFYFDTVESKLSVPSFNQLVSSLNVVTSNVSKAFLGEQSKCSIYILPSEAGSFKSKFCIFITGAIVTTVVTRREVWDFFCLVWDILTLKKQSV